MRKEDFDPLSRTEPVRKSPRRETRRLGTILRYYRRLSMRLAAGVREFTTTKKHPMSFGRDEFQSACMHAEIFGAMFLLHKASKVESGIL